MTAALGLALLASQCALAQTLRLSPSAPRAQAPLAVKVQGRLSPLSPRAFSLKTGPGLAAPLPLPLPTATVLPALPAPAVAGAAFSDQAEPANTGRPVLDRLASPTPFKSPEASDWQGEREYAADAFSFKLGDSEAVSEAAGGKAAPPRDGVSTADDGGGPDYPHRTVTFRKESFRSVLLRPNVPVEQEVVRMIQTAQKTIHIALYEFKQHAVFRALFEARKRGVEINIVMDYSSVFPHKEPDADWEPKRSREVWALLREGFNVKVVRGIGPYGIMHAKFAIADYGEKDRLAEFGSYNWSWTAENSHYENAQFTAEKDRIESLMQFWKWIDGQAKPVKYESQAKDYQWPAAIAPPPFSVEAKVNLNGTKLPMLVASPNSTPGQSIEDWMVKAIGAAREEIDVSIFTVRSRRITEALAEAKSRRGVKVRVIVDRRQSEEEVFAPFTQWLKTQGVEVKTLAGPDPASNFPFAQKMHHKFSIFDGKVVETGSPNYTKYAAIGNFELGHFLNDATDVKAYQFAFEHMWGVAAPLAAARTPAMPTDEELSGEVAKPLPPAGEKPPHPGPGPGIGPRKVEFNGETYGSYAFRPDQPVAAELIKAIRSAKKSVRLALYEFNLDSVLDALRWLKANKPSVSIEIVIDRAHVYTSGTDVNDEPKMPKPQILALIEEGFDPQVLKGRSSGMQHNKFLIIDGSERKASGMLISGSFNLTDQSEDAHYENVVFSVDPEKVGDFLTYYKYMKTMAAPVDPERLKKVLERGKAEAMAEAQAEGDLDTEGSADPEGAGSAPSGEAFEPPPPSRSKLVDFNGEKFHRTYFSPLGGIMDAWVRALKAAKSSVEIAMFSFYSRTVADTLVEIVKKAKKENPGIKVTVVLDEGQSKLTRVNGKFDGLSVAEWLDRRGVDVRLISGPDPEGDPMYQKQHNKFLVADRKLVLTGSFNLSDNAEVNNFENENVIDDPGDVAGYADYFQRMLARSKEVKDLDDK